MNTENDALDSIRNELNKIINDSSKKKAPLGDSGNKSQQASASIPATKIRSEYLDLLDKSEIGERAAFLNTTAANSIDENIQKVRTELKKSYQLFQSAAETFESINFNCLKHRIRDLHLSASTPEMDKVLEQKSIKESLNKLSDVMGDKFGHHPGEFADIPELSSFFKACSQLQHGLEALRRNRTDLIELGERMNWATNVAKDRADEIQKALNESKSKVNE